jgi:hypothetical protein
MLVTFVLLIASVRADKVSRRRAVLLMFSRLAC